MFEQILIAAILGIFIGIFTGLTPGVHVNLVSILVLSFSSYLLGIFNSVAIGSFIISLAITHTFLDALPSIYLGAPDEAQALNVLPGHRLLIKGMGHAAITYTVIGALSSLLLSLLLFPLFIFSMKVIEPVIKDYIGYFLVLIMAYMILKDKKRFFSFIMFLISGILGIIVLSLPNTNQPLLPLLSGLFGFSILVESLLQKSRIPEQNTNAKLNLPKKNLVKAGAAATGMGFIAAFLPGFGSSQAAIVATNIVGDIKDEGFLTLVGGINTANMLISIATAYILNKSRNGAILVVNQLLNGINFKTMLVFLAVALIAGAAAAILTLKISKIFCKYIVKVNYKALIISILIFVFILCFTFDSWIGLLILITSTFIGIAAAELGIGKNHLMGCLILPVILFFVL